MSETFGQFVIGIYKDLPTEYYVAFLIIFCIAVCVILLNNGIQDKWRILSKVVLSEYVVLTYSSTVFYRPYVEESDHNFNPFWSYFAIFQGKDIFFVENLLNIMVFVPIGMLLGFSFRRINWMIIFAFGLLMSLSIEGCQLLFKRGFAEFDDVFHNTLGCVIGFVIYKAIEYIAANHVQRK